MTVLYKGDDTKKKMKYEIKFTNWAKKITFSFDRPQSFIATQE